MILFLSKSHPAAQQLGDLSAVLRRLSRKEECGVPAFLAAAVNLSETGHGNHTLTYHLRPGNAASEDAMSAYQYVRRHYPQVLALLCHVSAKGAAQVTVEVAPDSRSDEINHSHHDLMRILPRILAIFRGTVSKPS